MTLRPVSACCKAGIYAPPWWYDEGRHDPKDAEIWCCAECGWYCDVVLDEHEPIQEGDKPA